MKSAPIALLTGWALPLVFTLSLPSAVILMASAPAFGAPTPSPTPAPPTVASATLPGITARELRQLIVTSDARATLVNVWASWCAPCKSELPALLTVAGEYSSRGVRLILVGADGGGTPAKGEADARQFLARFASQLGPNIPRFLLGEAPEAFVKALDPSWPPSVPATFFYDRQGKVSSFKVGQISREEIKNRLQSILNHEDMPRSR